MTRSTIHRCVVLALALSSFPAPSSVLAQAPAAEAPAVQAPAAPVLDGKTLFQQRTCFTCHGADAKTPILPEFPRLAGQNALYMLRQIKDIKSGARANGNTAAMRGVLHLVTEEEMAVLVQYLSELPSFSEGQQGQ